MMEAVQNWLASNGSAVLVGIIVVGAVAASILRESWLGDAGASDPAVVDVAARLRVTDRSPVRRWSRIGRNIVRKVIGLVMALALTVLFISMLVRFAVMT